MESPRKPEIHKRAEHAPSCAIAYGKEFWRRPVQSAVSKVNGTAPRSIDLSDMIARVSHAFRAADGKPRAQSGTYQAAFDEKGLSFSPLAEFPDQAAVEASFRTVAIQRGGQAIYDGYPNGASLVLGNTAQTLLSPERGIVEHYEARREGVAVTWVFAEPLAGHGPLVVTAEVDGLIYAGETPSGHHYGDDHGRARMRVGRATLVDRRGRKWDLPMHAAGNRLEISVAAVWLAEATYPLAIDPIISPEFGVDEPVVVPALFDQIAPAVAGNGTNYLVVWHNMPGTVTDGIYGARVSTAGEVLDLSGFSIVNAPKEQRAPAVAALGGNYLVVWEQTETTTLTDINGTRVTGDGVILDGALPIVRFGGHQQAPAVVANGTGYLVVWQDARTGAYDIYGRRVNADGMLLNETAISAQAGHQMAPSVASDGTNYLVAWEDGRSGFSTNIFFARLTDSGAVFEPLGVFVGGPSFGFYRAPSVAFNGASYLIAWQGISGLSPDFDIYGARVDSDGVILDTPAFTINRTTGAQTLPAVASASNNFLVAWQDARNANTTGLDIYGTQVTADGQILDTNGVAICTAPANQSAPAITFNGNYLVAWQDARVVGTSSTNIFGTLVSAAGIATNLNGQVISTAVNTEVSPAVAFNGANYLVVWSDERHSVFLTSQADIYGARITPDGSMLDPAGIRICSNGAGQYNPAVASHSRNFLVAWSDFRDSASGGIDVYGTLVSAAGDVANTNGVLIQTGSYAQELVIAAHPNGYLVVWQAGAFDMDIHGKRVTPAGTVLDESTIVIGSATGEQASPAIACNGTNFLVVWRDSRNFDVTKNDIYGVAVNWDGTVAEPSGIPISLALDHQSNPAVAAHGGNYLVVWQDNREATGLPPGSDIYGTVVTAGGVIVHTNGLLISKALRVQGLPAIAASENRFLVVWEDSRDFTPQRGFDVYAARVNPDGTVLDPNGFALNTNNNVADPFGLSLLPAVTYGSGGTFLIVHQGFRDGQIRTAANFVSLADLPTRILSITPNSGAMTLLWEAVTGNVYRVQFKNALNAPNWMDLNDEVVATGLTASKIDDTVGSNFHRFYRVVQVP